MTFEFAALLGMGAVLLFGLIALLLAFAAGNHKDAHPVGRHHA